MILLNMMIGPMAWILGLICLLLVCVIEAIILSKGLTKRWLNFNILTVVMVSNVISTFVGMFTMIWTIVIDTIEIIFKSQTSLGVLILALIITLIIELPINILLLKLKYKVKSIITWTIIANTVTYILIGLLTYNYI